MTDARTGFLQAVHIERIHGKSFIKRIVHTDENNDTPQILLSGSNIARSNDLYKRKDYPASVNYLRKELENILDRNLPNKVIKNKDGEDKTTLDSIITSGIEYLELLGEDPIKLKKCQQYLQILLNPLSHNEDDINAYEVDIKKIKVIIEELRVFLEDLKKRTKEIFPRFKKINLKITELDGVTRQEYLLELQQDLYCITQAGGSKKLSKCKVYSVESRTYKNGALEEKTCKDKKETNPYKNERWKKESLEILYNEICDYKSLSKQNYIDFYEKLDGTKLTILI